LKIDVLRTKLFRAKFFQGQFYFSLRAAVSVAARRYACYRPLQNLSEFFYLTKGEG
jgi:hypothetical protein